MRLRLVLIGCVVLAALSGLGPISPAYDPWAWILWGREIAHGTLATNQGPSWKPGPMLLTIPFGWLGGAAPALWVAVARAGGLLALAMAFRLGHRLAAPPGERAPGLRVGCGAAAALGVLLISYITASSFISTSFIGDAALGNSEGLLIAVGLLAVERHLGGHRRQTLALGFAAALLRPEAWPLLALYALGLGRRDRAVRLPALLGALGLAAAWFVPDLLSTGTLFRSAERAQLLDPGNPRNAAVPGVTVLIRTRPLLLAPLQAGFVLGLGWAVLDARRRGDRALLGLAALGLTWLVTVALMTQAGVSSGNPRYVLLPLAVGAIVGAVGLARLVGALRGAGRGLPAAAVGAAALVALGVAAAPRLGQLDLITDELRFEADLARDLPRAVTRVGGPGALRRCGGVYTGPLTVPAVAWALARPIEQVSIFVAPPGTIFQARATLDELPRPQVRADRPFDVAARVGRWTVLQGCAAG